MSKQRLQTQLDQLGDEVQAKLKALKAGHITPAQLSAFLDNAEEQTSKFHGRPSSALTAAEITG